MSNIMVMVSIGFDEHDLPTDGEHKKIVGNNKEHVEYERGAQTRVSPKRFTSTPSRCNGEVRGRDRGQGRERPRSS
jgi:hypothetical protein